MPVLYVPIAYDPYVLPHASLVIGGACVGTALALFVPGGRFRPISGGRLGALKWPLLAAAAAAILAFVFSTSWALSFAGAYTRYDSLPVRLAYLGLAASAVWLLTDGRSRDWVVVAFVLGTCLASLEALQQWAAHAVARPDGNLGNATLLAGLVAMAVPLALSRAWRGGILGFVWAAAAIVMAAGWFVTSSRSGAFAIAGGCLALVVLGLPARFATAAALGSLGVLAAGMLVLLLSPLRVLNSDPPELRLKLWSDGLHLIAARPLTGWGEDTTGLNFGQFLNGLSAPLIYDRVHSGPFDLAAMQGLIGVAALGWVLVVLGRRAWKHRFQRDVAALAAALAGYTVWVLFNFDWAPVTGAFWLLAGTMWAAAGDAQSATPEPAMARAGAARSSLALALVAAALGLALLPVIADVAFQRGRPDIAVALDPLQAEYRWGMGTLTELRRAADLGETAPDLYVQLGDAELRAGNARKARQDYVRALEINPYFTSASDRLAALGP